MIYGIECPHPVPGFGGEIDWRRAVVSWVKDLSMLRVVFVLQCIPCLYVQVLAAIIAYRRYCSGSTLDLG